MIVLVQTDTLYAYHIQLKNQPVDHNQKRA